MPNGIHLPISACNPQLQIEYIGTFLRPFYIGMIFFTTFLKAIPLRHILITSIWDAGEMQIVYCDFRVFDIFRSLIAMLTYEMKRRRFLERGYLFPRIRGFLKKKTPRIPKKLTLYSARHEPGKLDC